MSYSESVDVFFLGHGALYAEVEKHIADLNSLGYLRTCYWIDVENDNGKHSVTALDAATGKAKVIDVASAVREVKKLALVVALEELSDEETVDFSGVKSWAESIEMALPGKVERIRVLMPRIPLPSKAPQERVGWTTTVALAPEDSDNPNSALEAIEDFDNPYRAATVYAPLLVSLTGLWQESCSTPLLDDNGRRISTGAPEHFRLARAYHRVLDATELEKQLFVDVIDIKDQNPRISLASGLQTDYHRDMEEVNERFAAKFFERHSGNLITDEIPQKSPEEIRQNGWAALQAFLKEFFQAIGGSKAWRSDFHGALTDGTESLIKNVLYGDKSTVDVVLGKKRNATMKEINKGSNLIAQQANSQGFQVGSGGNLSSFWSDYTQAALTLVDGTPRLPGELAGPIDANKNPQIAQRANQVVPEVSESFEAEGIVYRNVDESQRTAAKVLPFDVKGVESIQKEIDYEINQSTGAQASSVRKDFNKWKKEMSQSFAWKTGTRLLDHLKQVQSRANANYLLIEQQESELSSLNARDYIAANKALSKKLRSVFGFEFILLLITAYCTIRFYKEEWRFFLPAWPGIDWRWCVLAVFIIVLLCTGVQMMIFARARRGIREEIERKKLLTANLDISIKNLMANLNDISKLSSAYPQFLSWSVLLGRAIAYPYGKAVVKTDEKDIPTSGLPRATKIGRVSLTEEAFTALSSGFRHSMFEEGWAYSAWKRFVSAELEKMKKNTGRNIDRISDLFGIEGYQTGSILDQLTQDVIESSVGESEQSREKWAQVLSSTNFHTVFDENSSTVEYYEENQKRVGTRDMFFGELKDIDETRNEFRGSAVSGKGVTAGTTRIESRLTDEKVNDGTHASLTNCLTLVQFSEVGDLGYLANDKKPGSENQSVEFNAEDELSTEGSTEFSSNNGPVFDDFGSI